MPHYMQNANHRISTLLTIFMTPCVIWRQTFNVHILKMILWYTYFSMLQHVINNLGFIACYINWCSHFSISIARKGKNLSMLFNACMSQRGKGFFWKLSRLSLPTWFRIFLFLSGFWTFRNLVTLKTACSTHLCIVLTKGLPTHQLKSESIFSFTSLRGEKRKKC